MLIPLKLTRLTMEEIYLLELYQDKLESLGFKFLIQKNSPQGSVHVEWLERPAMPADSIQLVEADIQELLEFLGENPHYCPLKSPSFKFSKEESYFASKACRTSVMIGTPLSLKEMTGIIRNLAHLDQPWVTFVY